MVFSRAPRTTTTTNRGGDSCFTEYTSIIESSHHSHKKLTLDTEESVLLFGCIHIPEEQLPVIDLCCFFSVRGQKTHPSATTPTCRGVHADNNLLTITRMKWGESARRSANGVSKRKPWAVDVVKNRPNESVANLLSALSFEDEKTSKANKGIADTTTVTKQATKVVVSSSLTTKTVESSASQQEDHPEQPDPTLADVVEISEEGNVKENCEEKINSHINKTDGRVTAELTPSSTAASTVASSSSSSSPSSSSQHQELPQESAPPPPSDSELKTPVVVENIKYFEEVAPTTARLLMHSSPRHYDVPELHVPVKEQAMDYETGRVILRTTLSKDNDIFTSKQQRLEGINLYVPVKEKALDYETGKLIGRTESNQSTTFSADVQGVVAEGAVRSKVDHVELTQQQLIQKQLALAAAAVANRRSAEESARKAAATALDAAIAKAEAKAAQQQAEEEEQEQWRLQKEGDEQLLAQEVEQHLRAEEAKAAAEESGRRRMQQEEQRQAEEEQEQEAQNKQIQQTMEQEAQLQAADFEEEERQAQEDEIRQRVQQARATAARLQFESDEERASQDEIKQRVQQARATAARLQAESDERRAAELAAKKTVEKDEEEEKEAKATVSTVVTAKSFMTGMVPEDVFNEEDDEEEEEDNEEAVDVSEPLVLPAMTLAMGAYSPVTSEMTEQQHMYDRPPPAPTTTCSNNNSSSMNHLMSPSMYAKSVSFDQLSVQSDVLSNFSADSAPVGTTSSTYPSPQRSKSISDIIRRDLWNNDELVVEAALRSLGEKAETHESYRSAIARAGGILAIVRAMEQHIGHAGTQVEACRALEKLALDTENELAIGEVGGVEAVLGAMMAHFTDSAVQEAAWSALWNCTCGNACDTMTIDTQGGMAAIVSCMKQHLDNAIIQASACGTLSNLCLGNENRLTALAEADGFCAIAQAMQRHWKDPVVRNEASHAMYVLLEKNANIHAKSHIEADEIDEEEEVIEEEVE